MTSLGIIGHESCNWEWKFYKTKWLGHKLVFPPILVANWVSSPLSFFLSASTAATCTFTAPTYTTTIITLQPCALNAEFQHFVLRFLPLLIQLKEAIGGVENRGDSGHGDFMGNSNIILQCYLKISYYTYEHLILNILLKCCKNINIYI